MKELKFIALFLLITLLCLPGSAEKRSPRKSMKELSDPASPSYVPNPYPKSRTEIIENIKYYYVDLSGGTESSFVGELPINDKIISNLFSENPNYKVGKIARVKNREARLPDDYTWLVYIMDANGDAIMRITLRASGIVMGSGAIDKNQLLNQPPKLKELQKRLLKVLTEKDVKKILSQSLGFPVDDKQIKKIERIGFYGTVGNTQTPLWEITMKDGTIYYYSELRDTVYSVSERISWKKDKKGIRPARRYMVPNDNYLPDTLNDEIIVLEPVTRESN